MIGAIRPFLCVTAQVLAGGLPYTAQFRAALPRGFQSKAIVF